MTDESKNPQDDDLMGAQDRSEKEAERWSEIEQKGQPVPSADQDSGGRTQSLIDDEPPVKEGDTPTGSQTPPEGIERPSREDLQPERRDAFPHPTDPDPAPEPDEPPLSEPEDDDVPFRVRVQAEEEPEEDTPPVRNIQKELDETPLPRQVPHEDPDATMASPSAFRDVQPAARRTEPNLERPDFGQETQRHERPQTTQPSRPIQSRAGQRASERPPTAEVVQSRAPTRPSPEPPRQQSRRSGESRRRKTPRINISWGCIGRTILLMMIGALVVSVLGLGATAVYYARVTGPVFAGIQTVEDLQAQALDFQTTRIRDSEGNVIYRINDPQGGLRDYVQLEEVSPYIIHATVATEERNYFTNPGFSIPAIVRAVVQNLREGRAISGASTITQQLTRALLLPEDERYERTYERKIKEIFLAAELGRRFSKEDILELYLNQVYYGNLAYGIEAAAQTYYGKPASELTLEESAYLGGIPQAPAVWDPVNDQEAANNRFNQVAGLMIAANCIDTGRTSVELPCVTTDSFNGAEIARVTTTDYQAPDLQARYPHWVVYVQQQLEELFGAQIYSAGYDVYTTLDPVLQDAAQQQVEQTLATFTPDRNVTNASVIVVDVETGEILTMVGSRDFNDESIDGQVNIALSLQQPGSSIKPFTYLTAFQQGWTPATAIWDVPVTYEIPGAPPYEPVNYDGTFRGPVNARDAVANSLNIPAVLTLDYVGVPALLDTLNKVGITTLGDPSNPNNYGLALTLGAGEVRLIEWTNAFATLANGGTYREYCSIERIELNGQVITTQVEASDSPGGICDTGIDQGTGAPSGTQVFDPATVYLMQSILSDYEARVPSFGRNSALSPPEYRAGAKTGTTNDFRDNWTMGFTTQIAVGVWVGNTDNSEMNNVTGVTGAGPIWRGVMDTAYQLATSGQRPQYQPSEFRVPSGIEPQEVCEDDGHLPSPFCEEIGRTYTDIFTVNNPPPPPEDGLYQRLTVDTFTGLIANDFCSEYAVEETFLVLPNPSNIIDLRPFERDWLLNTDRGRQWAAERGINLEDFGVNPPEEECGPDTPRPQLAITNPAPDSMQSGQITITGTAMAPNFDYYVVDFGISASPGGWGSVQGRTSQQVENGGLAAFNLAPFAGETITIRLTVYDTNGNSAEERVTFQVAEPTATPEPTLTPTPEVSPPEESTPEPTAEPTDNPDGGEAP